MAALAMPCSLLKAQCSVCAESESSSSVEDFQMATQSGRPAAKLRHGQGTAWVLVQGFASQQRLGLSVIHSTEHWQPLGCLQVQMQRWASAARLTVHRPRRRLSVAAPEEVAAHEHPLGPCLAPAVRDPVDAIITHRLVQGGRIG